MTAVGLFLLSQSSFDTAGIRSARESDRLHDDEPRVAEDPAGGDDAHCLIARHASWHFLQAAAHALQQGSSPHFVHSSAHCSHASSQTSHISSAIGESYSKSATHVRHVSMQVRQVFSQPGRCLRASPQRPCSPFPRVAGPMAGRPRCLSLGKSRIAAGPGPATRPPPLWMKQTPGNSAE